MSDRLRNAFRDFELCRSTSEGDVVEIPLLLSGRQARALERAAHDRGLTAGEMVRSLLRDFFAAQPCPDEVDVY
jgi:hypothetical protein